MRELSLSDFSNAVGRTFTVSPSLAPVQLTLAQAEEIAPSGRPAGSFRLEFRGPREPILEQATYRFDSPEDEFEMFIVPIGQDSNGTSYEAIFC